MIFNQEEKKVVGSKYEISKAIAWVCTAIFGLFGLGYTVYEGQKTLSDIKSTQKLIVSTSSNSEIHNVLENKSLDEKEKIYKVFSGISDYVYNSERIHKNSKLSDLIVEVILTYKLENFTDLDKVIQDKVIGSGLEKDATLVDNKEKIKVIFSELAESVKVEIENTKK